MLRPLGHRDFRLLWLGQSVSLVGDGIYLVAIAWLVYDISNQPGSLAVVGVAWTVPQVLVLLVAGVLSDRFERRRLLVLADLIRLLAIGALAALALAGDIRLWQVVALVIAYGIGEALFQPAFAATVPSVVPRDDLLEANALRELVEPIGTRFAGPAVGGALIAAFGVGEALAVDAATFGLSAGAVALMRRQPAPSGRRSSFRRELAEAFRYVRAHAWLWATLAGAGLALLLSYGPMEVLLPYIIRNDLGGDARTFGLVLAVGGAGSIVAAVVIARTGPPRRHVTFMWLTWSFAILLDLGLALAGAAWQMCLVTFVMFGASTVGLVVWSTLMQTLVPPEMLGRVSSLDWFVSVGLVPISFALTGPVAELFGARETMGAAGILGAASALLLLIPGVRDPEREPLPGPGTAKSSEPVPK
jgi:MFS family permease